MDDEVIQVAVGLLSSDHNILQQYLQNGSSTHHFIRKLMLITAQSITATQRLILAWTSLVPRPMTVVFGLETKLDVCMRTLENGILCDSNRPQLRTVLSTIVNL